MLPILYAEYDISSRQASNHLEILSHSTTSQTALNLLQLQPRWITTGLYQYVCAASSDSN
jgi:hypothetical protein